MTEKYRQPLSDNARRLELSITTSLTVSGSIPSEEEILALAEQLRKIPLYAVQEDEFADVIRRLHEALTIDMGLGSCVVDSHTPWLQARKAEIEPFYWNRYQTDLRKQGWGPKVVNALDKVTDEILDLMGDPADDAGWPRRGLVMGDVQSGKTSNYTGLICKAADAGYKLVILLTGTLESLRRQTQERLDAGFVGLDSSGVVNNRNRHRREIGVGLVNSARAAGVFTSTVGDFKAVTVNQLGFKLKDYNEPVLLVVKKNKRILENLTDWLVTFNATNSGQIKLPLLLIDDEADNASINTNPAKATAINAGIRSLLKVFPRSSYVGFTATPFANVFINPDTTDAMVGDDLFPRDFIYALDAPTNYLGARLIFGDDSPLNCLRYIDDDEVDLPKQKVDSVIDSVPQSMIDAVLSFFVVNAIMDLRGNMPKHRSMLINVSHFTIIQNQIRDILDSLVRRMQQDIRNYASLSEKEALNNATLAALYQVYKREYSGSGSTWAQVQKAITSASLPVEVRAVNQKTGGASLNYSLYKDNGLRVIAVGGNSLARGLTLEGLCISYFNRGTQMYDALLQMGRWFGYRPGYEDLFRIWLTEESANWYSHITEATDELRGEIKRMQHLKLKPIDFGLKVRASPDSLLITARNKMRDSEEIVHTISVSGDGLESSRLLKDNQIILGNFRAAQKLAAQIVDCRVVADTSRGYPFWTGVKKDLIVEFLRRFVSHPLNLKLQSAGLAEFIDQSDDKKLECWDVSIPSGGGGQFELIPGLVADLRVRKIAEDNERRSLLINEKKMRVGSPADEKAGLSKKDIDTAEAKFRANPINADKVTVPSSAYRNERRSPLLLLHLLKPTYMAGGERKDYFLPEECKALVAIGLSFPPLAKESQSLTYRINLVELRNMLVTEIATDDDVDDEGDSDDE